MTKALIHFFFLFFVPAACCESFLVEEVNFKSHNIGLSGSIVFPTKTPIHSAVVFVHGSGKQERNLYWAERFASEGIVALVYDKRGVGRSGGRFESKQPVSEKNLNLLADDALAALGVLQKHPKTEKLLLGLTGISQAGWIVPLAAEKAESVDFIALWSGPVCKVSEEDIYSKHTADLDGKKLPSFNEALNSRKDKYIWPAFLGKDTDSSAILRNLSIPGLWVFGGKDGSIPVDLSLDRLTHLSNSGYPYDYVLFSYLGHNNMEETFNVVTSWINNLKPPSSEL